MTKLSPNIVDSESILLLSQAKIFSVNDFLQADIERIVLFSKLTLEEVLQLKNDLIIQFSNSSITRDQFCLRNNEVFLKTHIEGLDQILKGGMVKGSIIELCGPSGCGKSQLCHSIAVNCALHSVLVKYIDTKEDFSASRSNRLLPNGLKDEEMDHILEKINVYSTRNIYELISVLRKIHQKLKTHFIGKDLIVIIDSVTVPYLPFVGVSSCKVFSILNSIASTLKQIATEFSVIIVMTNIGVTYNENEDELTNTNYQEVKPLMGKYWQHVPNTRLIITRDSNSGGRRIVVHKSDYIGGNENVILK